jgi:hypothetical protein
MLRCSEVVRLISSDEYATAGLWKKLQTRLHLAMCVHCSRYVRQLRAIAAAFRRTQDSPPPSQIEAAKSRIIRELSEK